MATLAERIVDKLRVQARALDDDQLAAYLGVIRQAVNQACRRLEREGVVERYVGPDGKIVNRLLGAAAPSRPLPTNRSAAVIRSEASTLITEDEVKTALKAHLEAQGVCRHGRLGTHPGG